MTGHVRPHGGGPASACIVEDLSRGGAGLSATGPAPFPERFDLALADADVCLAVRLVWQRGRRAGVAFLERRPGPPVLPECG